MYDQSHICRADHMAVSKASRTLRRRKRKGKTSQIPYLEREYIALSQWMKRNKFVQKRPYLSAAIFNSTGRGLMTRHSISAGSTLVSIPHHLLITPHTVLTSVGQHFTKWDKQLSSQQAMSIFLLAERQKQESSFWFPYINVLPKKYTTPAFFSETELNLLPQTVLSKALTEISKVHTAFKLATDFITCCWPELAPVLTYSDFIWSWYSVNTRSVYYKHDLCDQFLADHNYIALAPFLDLLNHSYDANITASFNVKSNCYEIQTEDTYRKYDEVFISYGNHDNTHLLVEYGFVLPNNPNDVVEFSFDSLLDIALRMKLKHLKEKRSVLLTGQFDRKLCCCSDGLSWNLQVVLRVLCMDWTELKNWKLVMQGGIISDQNELLTRTMASTLIKTSLGMCKENLTKFQGLHCDTMTEHERLAYDFICIERTTLQSALISVQS
ncbi:SET domain-containing protein 4-like [Pecten maximus]|uniref:SET domain-containing protein 4-like n=1 Tax=Pecten maximus TaxID=6579 RepID=UPI0014588C6F|nr:SET domain-containing protein 4-like [Pecten maximus]